MGNIVVTFVPESKFYPVKKFILLLFCTASYVCNAQFYQSLDTIKAPDIYENIFSKHLFSDSLTSSFVIFVKKEVKAHKHIMHTEQVYLLDGEGEMVVGIKKITVKKGDMIFIPKGTVHSLKVTSTIPVKALSVQSPLFDGKDRVVVEESK